MRDRSTSDVNSRMCDSRRGRTFGAFERAGAAPAPLATTAAAAGTDLVAGDTFGAASTCTSTPSGSRNQSPDVSACGCASAFFTPSSREALPQCAHVLGERAEREVLEALRGAAAQHRAPAMRMTERMQVQAVVAPLDLEAEVVVEARGRVEIRDRKDEMIERMHRGDAGAPRSRRISCHDSSSCLTSCAPIIAPEAGVP